MVPRHPWMARFGRSIESVRPALKHARDVLDSDENQRAVGDAVRRLRHGMARAGR